MDMQFPRESHIVHQHYLSFSQHDGLPLLFKLQRFLTNNMNVQMFYTDLPEE